MAVAPKRNPYALFLDQVEKPARYIGGEKFVIEKDWETTKARVALCFPDAYEIGMSHLGFKILYDELNRDKDILAERAFAPWIDMEKQMRERNLPLVTLENFRPLSDFDILGFSLQYEMTYTNILNMLDLGGVTLWQKERRQEEPFVIVGGPCATHPEPLAPFVDFVVVGDGEELFARIALFIGHMRREQRSRGEILETLARWQGIYVPSLYSTKICEKTDFEVVDGAKRLDMRPRVERFFVEDLKSYPIPTTAPIPHMTAIFDRFSVELARGCTEGCRFCQAGMIYRPVRERRPQDVIQAVMDGVAKGGFNEASLTCLSTADYSAITPLLLDLLDKMKEDQSSLGISSLRAYGLDNRIFDKMAEVKNTSLTFAPEGGTERMRKVINKNVSEEDMMKTAEDVFSRGWSKMKLYFMIGLPTEEDEDVVGIMETGRKARNIGKKMGVRSPQVTISASSFVPKPHTPFQWAAMITLPEIERKQEMLFQLSRQYKLNFRKHLAKTSFIEGIIARGDRPVAQLIFDAWKEGARFDGWHETFDYGLWLKVIEKNQIDPAKYLGTIRMDGRLPWDHIDVGLEDKFLEREWKKATKNRLSPPCGKPAGDIVHHSNLEEHHRAFEEQRKKLVCYHCGVACDLDQMKSERAEYLTDLKAFKDLPYEKPAHVGKPLIERRERRGQNVGEKYRLSFSKIGPISFISHLDMQKVVARIFKRAQLSVLYSEGYNRRPLISFGPALSLGISSLQEFCDVRVPHPWSDLDVILERLNECSEKGLIFHSIKQLLPKTPSIQQSITQLEYFIPTMEAPEEIIHKITEGRELTVSSYSKKKKCFEDKDIRPWLGEIRPGQLSIDPHQLQLIDEVSPCKDHRGLFVRTKVESGSSIRPGELIQVLQKLGVKTQKPIKTAVIS